MGCQSSIPDVHHDMVRLRPHIPGVYHDIQKHQVTVALSGIDPVISNGTIRTGGLYDSREEIVIPINCHRVRLVKIDISNRITSNT